MTKAPMSLQELRRRISHKATSEPTHRFWGLLVHVAQPETLHEAYHMAQSNNGAPGIDGQTFEDIEAAGRWTFLAGLQDELLSGRDHPRANRRVDIPKGTGTVRTLQMPGIRDRVVQGALTWILEPLCEADVCDNSYGYRPGRSPQQALAEVRRRLLRRMTTVIDVEVSNSFDPIRHAVLRDKIARRVHDPQVRRLIKQILTVSGTVGVPQGGPLSPLAAHLSLSEVDGVVNAIRRTTAEGPYEAVNSPRFADDRVLAGSGHWSKRGWAQRALHRLQEHLTLLGVRLNPEQTPVVDTLTGDALQVMGFDLRRVPKRRGQGYCILMTPKKEARTSIKARSRASVRHGGATPMQALIAQINQVLMGWVNSFRWENARRAFSDVRDDVEMKSRPLLTRRKRRHKRRIGWRRWSHEYLYGVLGVVWDWKVRPLPRASQYT
jgi:RNA-directed DNA polymerase